MLHKNSQKRIYEEGAIYFITSKVDIDHRVNLGVKEFFREEIFCELWLEELKLVKELKQFELFAFCLLPDHFHLLLRTKGNENISRVMQFFKRHFSRNANWLSGCLPEGDIRECRLLQDEDNKHLKEVVSSHDEKLREMKKRIRNHFPKFVWQKSFHDHIIRGERDFENHFIYATQNHIKHGLSENWKYTSLNYSEMIDDLG
ncbi:MAG: transposase [Patescibacteria group bacterium]